MKAVKFLVPLILTAVLLGGCSFEELFAKLATSNVEEGAREEYQQSKIAEEKMQKINEKKAQFTESTQLRNATDATKFVAFAFRKHEGTTTYVDVEALLSNPGNNQIYEVWLRNDKKEKEHLGAMQFNRTDDYSLSYKTDKNISDYNTILISREAVPDETIETIVMTGAFAASTQATASAKPQK